MDEIRRWQYGSFSPVATPENSDRLLTPYCPKMPMQSSFFFTEKILALPLLPISSPKSNHHLPHPPTHYYPPILTVQK